MSDYWSDSPPGPLFAQRAPAVQHSVTSMQAADSLAPATLSRLERMVLDYVGSQPGGVTDEQIIAGTGLNPSTARPRRVALERLGLVVPSGTRRTTSGRMATVWRKA